MFNFTTTVLKAGLIISIVELIRLAGGNLTNPGMGNQAKQDGLIYFLAEAITFGPK
jgi:hypothetical protein